MENGSLNLMFLNFLDDSKLSDREVEELKDLLEKIRTGEGDPDECIVKCIQLDHTFIRYDEHTHMYYYSSKADI